MPPWQSVLSNPFCCHCEGRRPVAIRTPQPFLLSLRGPQARGNPYSPTLLAVIARAAGPWQSVLPCCHCEERSAVAIRIPKSKRETHLRLSFLLCFFCHQHGRHHGLAEQLHKPLTLDQKGIINIVAAAVKGLHIGHALGKDHIGTFQCLPCFFA